MAGVPHRDALRTTGHKQAHCLVLSILAPIHSDTLVTLRGNSGSASPLGSLRDFVYSITPSRQDPPLSFHLIPRAPIPILVTACSASLARLEDRKPLLIITDEC